MDATIAPIHPAAPNRRARRAVAPAAPATSAAPVVQQLPMRVAAGVRVSAPNWMWIVGGGVIGGLLLGPLGAIGGALAGAMLVN